MKFHLENLNNSISSYDLQEQQFRSPTRLHYSSWVTLWKQSSAEYALREFGVSYWKAARWTSAAICRQNCVNKTLAAVTTEPSSPPDCFTCHLPHRNTWHTLRTAERDYTWHDGDRLEGPQYAEGPQAGQVAHIHADGGVPWGDDDEVQPVPGIPQVRVLVKNEALGDRLDYHLCRVDCKEYVPERAWHNWNCVKV